MQFQIVIDCETDYWYNDAVGDDGSPVNITSPVMGDVITTLETMLPYMLDNVIVTSRIVE